MNTKNIHYFPLNLALLLVFGFLCALPFSAFSLFSVEKPTAVLGTKSIIIENVTLTKTSQSEITEFKYSLSPFEEKQINISGNKLYLKQFYQGVEINIIKNTLYIKNLTPNSYLIEGLIYQ